MVVGASVGVSLALRLGPGVSDLVAEGSEMLGTAVRLGRASPEPPPHPVVTASVSAASATMTGLAFFTASAQFCVGSEPPSLARHPLPGLACRG